MVIWHINRSQSDGSFSVISANIKDLNVLGCISHTITSQSPFFKLTLTGQLNLLYINVIYFINRIFRKFFTYEKFYFYNFLDFGFFLNHKLILRNYPLPDIIILYWTSSFVSTRDIEAFKSNTGARIYIYPMDFNPITGGCHYFGSCNNYTSKCQECPAFKYKIFDFISKRNLLLKKTIYDKCINGFISASNNITFLIGSSQVGSSIEIVQKYISIDEHLFSQRKKEIAQNHFSFHTNKFAIFSAAKSLKEERKGFTYLIGALNYICKNYSDISNNIVVILAGKIDNKDVSLIPVEFHSLGLLNLEELSFAYNLCDIFINTSIEDAGPMMINQSLMSGTPVISFKIGVANDLVIDNYSGFLATAINAVELAKAIINAYELRNNELKIMGNNAREISLKYFGHEISTKKFQSILNKSNV